MKKLLLSLALLFAGISGDALARRCNRGSCNSCPTRCAKPCPPKCPKKCCVNACSKIGTCENCPGPESTCSVRYVTAPAMTPRVVWEPGECVHEVKTVCNTTHNQHCISGIQPRGAAAAKYGAENVTEYSDEQYSEFAGEDGGCF